MQYQNLIDWLKDCGFEEAEKNTEPTELGTMEYMLAIAGGKRMLTIGCGQSGDSGCYTVFYFTLDSGEFLQFGTSNEEDQS